MTSILVDKTPVIIKEKMIVEFEVSNINFTMFQKLASDTSSLVPAGGKRWATTNKRLRIKHQVRALTEAGERLVLDDLDITQLPRIYAGALNNALITDESKPGEMIGAGDGISTPILFKLGTPIKAQSNNEAVAISELEFMASTFGDVEDVLSEVDILSQTVALLRTVAKPLGLNDSLQRLPEWALDRIALADGFKLSEEVLPRFLE